MTDAPKFAVCRWKRAVAEDLDRISYSIKCGRETDKEHARQLRRLADILAREV